MASDKHPVIKNGKGNDNHKKGRRLLDLATLEEDWHTYKDAEKFLEYISPLNGYTFTKHDTEVKVRALPFYKDVELLSVSNLHPSDDPDEEYNFCFLQKGDHLVWLTGECSPIFEINETGCLELNSENVFDYLKFFSLFIVTEEEMMPYYVVEGPESEYLDESSPYEKNRILRDYKGPRIIASADQKSFMIETRLIYNDALFDAKFKILSDGEIIMTNDTPIGNI